MHRAFIESTREKRVQGQKLIVILDQAFLYLYEKSSMNFRLATSSHNITSTTNAMNVPVEDRRPDIVHQCLLTLLDSPLNRSGKLLIYIRLTTNEVIEVSPQLTIPRSWSAFECMMITFLHTRVLKADKSNVVLMRFIKKDLEKFLVPGCPKIGFSRTGSPINLNSFCEQFKTIDHPIICFIGAVAKSNPTTCEACPDIEQCVQISPHPLTAAITCGKLCGELELIWKIL